VKIKNQFRVSILVFIVILGVIVGLLIFTMQQTTSLNSQAEIALGIQTGASDLSYSSNNFFLYQRNSDVDLWQFTYSELTKDLAKLNPTDTKQRNLFNNVQDDLQRLDSVFLEVVSFLENAPSNIDVRVSPEFQTAWNRMAVQNQALAFDAQQLSQTFRSQVDQLNQTNLILIVALLGLFWAYFFTNYLVTYRKALKSISDLQAGITVIGSGNFDYSLKTTQKDEIGEVSKSVNLMAANLKTVTASKAALENEIEERKKAEEALIKVKLDLNHAQAVGKIGSWRLDLEHNVLLWSDENYRIFGVPQGTPMTYEAFLSIVHPEDRDYVNHEWKAALRGEPYDIEHRIIFDGKVKWVREKAELEFDKDRKLKGGFGTTQEITDFAEMRNQLEDASAQLQEYANDMEQLAKERAEKLKDAERLAAIGATAGMVGHDIRNPLQAITGDVFLAKTELACMPDSEEKKNALESMVEIEKNIDYINKIVQDLQDYARPLNPKNEESDLKLIVETFIAKNGLPKNIEVNIKITDDARKIRADSHYLNRILFNLVTNAVQAMPNGGKLTIDAHKETGDTILLVKDTGVGIPREIQDKMFTLMFTTKSKGQGFGLPVVKRMTESLGGTVTFESQVGKGTTFIIRLHPRAKQ
jgi:signal transduction histidine kinase